MKLNTPKSQSTLANVVTYLRAHPGADAQAIASQFGLSLRSAQRYAKLASREPEATMPRFLDLKEMPEVTEARRKIERIAGSLNMTPAEILKCKPATK